MFIPHSNYIFLPSPPQVNELFNTLSRSASSMPVKSSSPDSSSTCLLVTKEERKEKKSHSYLDCLEILSPFSLILFINPICDKWVFT